MITWFAVWLLTGLANVSADAPRKPRRLGRNHIIHATNPTRAVSASSTLDSGSHSTVKLAGTTETYALVPNINCASKVRLCYEGAKDLLKTILKDDSFNPCHGTGSDVQSGLCAHFGYSAFLTHDPMYKKAKLYEKSQHTNLHDNSESSSLGGGYDSYEPHVYDTRAPTYAPAYTAPTPAETSPVPTQEEDGEYGPLEEIVESASAPEYTPAPYPTPYITEVAYEPPKAYPPPKPADELYDIQAASADPGHDCGHDSHWYFLPAILGSCVLVCCIVGIVVSCYRSMAAEPPTKMAERGFYNNKKYKKMPETPTPHDPFGTRSVPPMHVPTTKQAAKSMNTLLNRNARELRRAIARELKIPPNPDVAKGQTDHFTIDYSDLLEYYLLKIGHEPEHIKKVRKLWKIQIDSLNNLDQPGHGKVGKLPLGTSGLLTNGGHLHEGEIKHMEMRMKLTGDLKKIGNHEQFKQDFQNEFAHLHQIEPSRITVTGLAAGSIMVDFKVLKCPNQDDNDLINLSNTMKNTQKLANGASSFFQQYKPDPYFAVISTTVREQVAASSYGGTAVTEATRQTDTTYAPDKKFHKVNDTVNWTKGSNTGVDKPLGGVAHVVTATANKNGYDGPTARVGDVQWAGKSESYRDGGDVSFNSGRNTLPGQMNYGTVTVNAGTTLILEQSVGSIKKLQNFEGLVKFSGYVLDSKGPNKIFKAGYHTVAENAVLGTVTVMAQAIVNIPTSVSYSFLDVKKAGKVFIGEASFHQKTDYEQPSTRKGYGDAKALKENKAPIKPTKEKCEASKQLCPPRHMYNYKAEPFPAYKDPQFMPHLASVGRDPKWNDDEHRCTWKRCNEIGLTKLWEEDEHGHAIDPGDINQGQLGDCWLLSSISCLAEFESAVQDLFVTKEYNPEGIYTLCLFDTGVKNADGTRGRWVHVTVDDYLPCLEKDGAKSPAFAHPRNSQEMWVSLLEKAFAKVHGSYQALSGGYNWFAFQMLTGCDTEYFAFSNEEGVWQEDFTQYVAEDYSCAQMNTAVSSAIYVNKDAGGTKSHDALWEYLREADQKNWLIAASTKGRDEMTEGGGPQASKGMVDGHAYSVIVVQQVGEHRLLCIRNPWGTFEWPGDWSDGSSMWKEHATVRPQLIASDAKNEEYLQFNETDGLFWMDFKDFTELFAGIVLCKRTEKIQFDKREQHADKCTWCSGPLIEVPGKFEGKFFVRKNGVKVHTECWDEYNRSTKPKCLQCGEPIMKIVDENSTTDPPALKFSGKFYRVEPYAEPKGKVHTECWDGKGTWTKKY